MTFGSLFAGIGGMDLGLERAGMKCVWQVEIDPYATRVLEKHWPLVRRHGDVRTFPPEPISEWGCDLICGGFPCQPISFAGEMQFKKDSRWLWPEFARVLRILRPRLALLENVPGLFVRGMDDVLGSLAEIGFHAEWQTVPAGLFGTHFPGERVFIIASGSPTCCLRRQGRWEKPKENECPWGPAELERLVRLESSVSVPAGSRGRVSDGISHRMDRLRGLGNAVVPAVAEWIGRQILRTEEASVV